MAGYLSDGDSYVSESESESEIDHITHALVHVIFPQFSDNILQKTLTKNYPFKWMTSDIPQELLEFTDSLDDIPDIGMKIIMLFMYQWYQQNNTDGVARNFSIGNAFQILRWIGPNCYDFLLDVIAKKTTKQSKCRKRWEFLESQWDSPNLYISLPSNFATQEIRKNHGLYFIRLSGTHPGSITVDSWDPKKRNILSARFQLHKVPATIAEFDQYFRDYYFNKFRVRLQSIIEEDEYEQLKVDYSIHY